MSSEKEATLKALAEQQCSGSSGTDSLVRKSEMKSEMRCMIQELLEMGMIGSKPVIAPSELKLELVPNDVKLDCSKNYLSWSRRVRVLLGAKGVEPYLEEECIEPTDKLSMDWRVCIP